MLGVIAAYTAQISAPANASINGSGFDAILRSADCTSRLSPPTAIVEEIHEDGSILISESGGGQRRAWTRLLAREQAENPGITYIH